MSKLNEVQALQTEANELPLTDIPSEDEVKEQLMSHARAIAVDHFAGRQKELEVAMNAISKYKKQYESVPDVRNLPKIPPNAMHGKPFIERLVPGIGLQFVKRGDMFSIDFNPYVGYRISGKVTAGLGWNQRVVYDFDASRFAGSSGIFGPRAFAEYKLTKGFSPRVEAEFMKTRVPPSIAPAPVDELGREWVFGFFTGIKKEYKIFRRVKGTATLMVRVSSQLRKSPYTEWLNPRIGFEWPLSNRSQREPKRSD